MTGQLEEKVERGEREIREREIREREKIAKRTENRGQRREREKVSNPFPPTQNAESIDIMNASASGPYAVAASGTCCCVLCVLCVLLFVRFFVFPVYRLFISFSVSLFCLSHTLAGGLRWDVGLLGQLASCLSSYPCFFFFFVVLVGVYTHTRTPTPTQSAVSSTS